MAKRIPVNRTEFTRDWLDGMRVDDMATKYGMTAATVSRRADHYGLPSRQSKGHGKITATRSPSILHHGISAWVQRGHVMVWVAR